MIEEKIIEFAKKNGYDGVEKLPKWRGYDAYEPIMDGDTSYIGLPLAILVKGDEIRMTTSEEALEMIE